MSLLKKSLTIRRGRDRLTVTSEILNMARDGINKTQIMYGARLSYKQLEDYLSFLQETKLLEVETKGKGTIYKTTSKGLVFLFHFSHIKNLIQREGKVEVPRTWTLESAISRVEELEKEQELTSKKIEELLVKLEKLDRRLNGVSK